MVPWSRHSDSPPPPPPLFLMCVCACVCVCYVCMYVRAFSLLAIWCLGPRVQILHSAEEHNLSPFESKLTTTNMYIARARCENQLGSTGLNFSLILDSSVGLSASIQSAGDLVFGTPGSNPAFSRVTQLVSFRFEYRLPVPEHRN